MKRGAENVRGGALGRNPPRSDTPGQGTASCPRPEINFLGRPEVLGSTVPGGSSPGKAAEEERGDLRVLIRRDLNDGKASRTCAPPPLRYLWTDIPEPYYSWAQRLCSRTLSILVPSSQKRRNRFLLLRWPSFPFSPICSLPSTADVLCAEKVDEGSRVEPYSPTGTETGGSFLAAKPPGPTQKLTKRLDCRNQVLRI